jgi:hypothetical protein
MSYFYRKCESQFEHRRKGNNWKRVSHNQILLYDAERDCYRHQHHSTVTVEVFPDKARVFTGGWDTVTTWAKIREYCNIRVGTAPKRVNANKCVYWDRWTKFTPFYEGIEIDEDGVPLKPEPYEKYVLKRGATKEINAAIRAVRDRVTARALLGEFDLNEYVWANERNDEHLCELVFEIAKTPFSEITSKLVGPLFVQRVPKVFGKDDTWRYRVMERDGTCASAETRLESNLTAAKRAVIGNLRDHDLYDRVLQPPFER